MDRLLRSPLDRLTSTPEPAPLGDEEVRALVERARGGDREAFGQLARAHYRRTYATARRLVGNHEDAEDLTQETFVRAHQALRWFRGEASFAGWLRRILVHLATDRFRRAGRSPEQEALADLPDPSGARSAADEAGARELSALVERAIETLPPRLRVPLALRTLEGLDYAEVAAATGVTPATARTQVMHARRALARHLARFLRPDDDTVDPRGA